jgi:hypothetical protein
MRLSLLILVVTALASGVHAAPEIKYPYETVVEKDETYVRSGPSTKFYPTTKLRRGDKVIVHRPDPGGWLMIAPPPGSFSWVPAKYVKTTDADRGTIKVNRVAARVGSFESDIREVFQRPLAEGDEVHILGEKMLAPESGNGPAELWYRIEPPRGEWRWVMGQDVAPVARQAEDRPAGDPFERPLVSDRGKRSSPRLTRIEDDAPSFEKPIPHFANREYLQDSAGPSNGEPPLGTRPLVRKESSGGVAKTANRNQEAILDELDRLDARFRSILIKPVLEWDFGQVEHDYQALRGETDSGNIQQMIDTRLIRIAGYRETRTAEEDLARVQSETARRDAELAEIQRRQEAQLASLRQPRFDGAGLVQRSALTRRGAPPYVLLAPSGRVLAYLVPAPGVNLEGWIGRAAGVYGSRLPHPELKADLITVNRLTAVRLVP